MLRCCLWQRSAGYWRSEVPAPEQRQPERVLDAVERVNDMNKPLEDLSPMPFGKYKGTPMQDVPADYLHWLWTNGKDKDKICPVADYIRRSLSALKVENKNLIW